MMQSNVRWPLVSLTLCTAVVLFAGISAAEGDKEPWKAMLPKDVYEELAKREAEIIREKLNGKIDDLAIARAKVGALLLAALTMTAKDVDVNALNGTRNAAFYLAGMLDKKGQLDAAKKLATLLPNKGKVEKTSGVVNWNEHVTLAELMDHLRPKDKGGDGMHPDLQSNIRLKGALNSVEEKIRAISMKEMAATALKKEAKELEYLGYRTAVIGSLAYHFAPAAKSGKKDPQEWWMLSLKTRDLSVGLAEAAKKGDTAALFKVSNDLNSACTQCHTVFR